MEVVDQGRTEIGEHMVECMNGDHTFDCAASVWRPRMASYSSRRRLHEAAGLLRSLLA